MIYTRSIPTMLKEAFSQRIDAGLRSLRLVERGRKVRRALDMMIRGIEVETIPHYLGEGKNAILVSNYPSVSQTLRAVIIVGCRLPGQRVRLKAIARKELLTESNALLKALGVDRFILPAMKDEAGKYTLKPETFKEVLAHLEEQGNVLWLSITGKTRGNGLLERDLRTGAALFYLKKGIPIVPMALVTRETKGKLKVTKVRFGEPINPLNGDEISEFEMGDFLVDVSRLIMCEIARLLPAGQRGDFENVEDKLREVKEKLERR